MRLGTSSSLQNVRTLPWTSSYSRWFGLCIRGRQWFLPNICPTCSTKRNSNSKLRGGSWGLSLSSPTVPRWLRFSDWLCTWSRLSPAWSLWGCSRLYRRRSWRNEYGLLCVRSVRRRILLSNRSSYICPNHHAAAYFESSSTKTSNWLWGWSALRKISFAALWGRLW